MSYALLSETWPKARKQHECIWCAEAINKGDTYRHEKSVYDGNMQDHKWHPECSKAAAESFAEGDTEFLPYSNERPVALAKSARVQ